MVTGGSSGIGRAIALAFADEGADVLLSYRRNAAGAEGVAAAVRATGGQAFAISADLQQRADVDRLVNEAFAQLGRVDVWVNNAGADILTGAGGSSPTSTSSMRPWAWTCAARCCAAGFSRPAFAPREEA